MNRARCIVALLAVALYAPGAHAATGLKPASSAGGGSVSQITSSDGTVNIGNPTGPTVDLSTIGSLVRDSVNTSGNKLSTLGSASYTTGARVWVSSVGGYFQLAPTSLTVDHITVETASGKGGYQWVRVLSFNAAWASQTSWTVDPQNGAANDENAGSGGSPLKTLSEVARRMASAIIPSGTLVTVNLLSDCQSTDKPIWTFVTQPGTSGGDGVALVGTPTSLYSGTLTSAFVQQVQGNTATATDNEIIDSAIPTSYTASGLIAAGLIFKRTNSTALWWFGIKDLGSKTARISDASTATGTVTALVNGDSYTVYQLPKIYDQSWPLRDVHRNGTTAKILLQFVDDRSTQNLPAPQAGVVYDRSTVSTARTFPVNVEFLNSAIWAGATFTGNTVFMKDGAVVGAFVTVTNGGRFLGSSAGPTHFQGSTITATTLASIDVTTIAGYDVSGSAVVTVSKLSGFSFVVFKGKGNTSKLIQVLSGCLAVYTGSPPTTDASSSDPSPLTAGGTSFATASLPYTTNLSVNGSGIVVNQ